MVSAWSRRVMLMAVLALGAACNKQGVFFVSMNPTSGRPGGGEEVRIRGSGFKALGNIDIRIGGHPATNIAISDDETIVLTTPEGREADQGHPLDVYLMTADGKSYVFRGAFTYRRVGNDPNAPNADLQRRL